MSNRLLIVVLILAALVFYIFLRDPGINDYYRAMFADMVYGRAYKPFVARVLLPAATRLITSTIPDRARSSLCSWAASNSFVQRVFEKRKWELEYFVEYCIAAVLMYASLVGFVFAFRHCFRGVYDAPGRFLDAITLIALLSLPVCFRYYSYLYDFPVLLLFTLGLGLMVRSKWSLYLIVFLFAVINKETAILLSFVFVIHHLSDRRMPRLFFWRLLAIQMAIFVAVRAVISFVFRNNPGTFLEFHLFDHNIRLLRPYPLATVLSWFIVVFFVFYRWNEKPLFLRYAIWIAVPLVGMTVFFGFLDELRGYYELYPIVILLFAHTLAVILEIPLVDSSHRATYSPPIAGRT